MKEFFGSTVGVFFGVFFLSFPVKEFKLKYFCTTELYSISDLAAVFFRPRSEFLFGVFFQSLPMNIFGVQFGGT